MFIYYFLIYALMYFWFIMAMSYVRCTDESHVAHMNESCHTYEWVTLLIRMSHVTHVNESCHTYKWVMSHIWMSHSTHMNESRHTFEWVMSHIEWVKSHIWMSHVTHMNESRHMYRWVTSHTWISHVTHMNEPRHTYRWEPSTWMSHATHMNESRHTYERGTSQAQSSTTPPRWRAWAGLIPRPRYTYYFSPILFFPCKRAHFRQRALHFPWDAFWVTGTHTYESLIVLRKGPILL